jgi:hypothetical protein
MNQPAKIGSVSEAIESIHFCGFEKGQMLFRGQANYHWGIDPSLFRVCDSIRHARFYETATIGPLLLKFAFPYLHSFDPIEHLMIAQHFGIPTRLLDWSYDILIALFFACYDKDNKFSDKDGRLFLIETGFFNTFPINSTDQRVYKSPIDPNNTESHAMRLSVDNIYIVNPVIRNPRMRVQEGCFMFFPWVFAAEDTELLSFQRYIQGHRKFVDKHNSENEEQLSPIFLAEKRVDHESKASILKELDERYGISQESIMIDCLYTREIEVYYSQLKEHVEQKSRELVKLVEDDK